MNMYQTTSTDAGDSPKTFTEFASSASDASKARTRLKKAYQVGISTEEVDVPATRAALIVFMNKLTAHESWTPVGVASALGG